MSRYDGAIEKVIEDEVARRVEAAMEDPLLEKFKFTLHDYFGDYIMHFITVTEGENSFTCDIRMCGSRIATLSRQDMSLEMGGQRDKITYEVIKAIWFKRSKHELEFCKYLASKEEEDE